MNQTIARIIRCQECGTNNKIPHDKAGAAAKCGKCHAKLDPAAGSNGPAQHYTIRCLECKAKNRIPAAKIDAGPKCGKCGTALLTGELFKPQPVMVTDGNFDDAVLNSPLPVLVFCWAPWCPSCGTVTPIIDEFANDTKGKIRVGKLNIDSSRMVASKYNILSVPYLLIFDNGRMVDSLPGGMGKHELMMKMARYL